MKPSARFHHGWTLLAGVAAFGLAGPAARAAAPVDVSKLPPAAAGSVDFVRDIKPMLEQSCLKCHGPERPKSGFRIHNRAAALKGGDTGVDIVPGQSAKSPLIHYVARLVEDMEMPPHGKGEPLTATQVGLLRAWIDQDKGQDWSLLETPNKTEISLSETLSWLSVSGNKQVFREQYWRREGWNGGLDRFELKEKTGPESTVTLKGRALRDDYGVTLSLERNNLGFVRFGADQYRKYYSDSGGFYPGFDPALFRLERDLHLDIGRAWVDLGLTMPHWPRMVLGYEYQYKDGEKSTLQWGAVVQGTEDLVAPGAAGVAQVRNLLPASKSIAERVHILKFDLDHELGGVRIEDRFRGEFYGLQTSRDNLSYNAGPGTMTLTGIREGQNYFRGANGLRLEKQFSDWFLGSGGYFYSKMDADSSVVVAPEVVAGPIFSEDLRSNRILLDMETHAFNLNGLWGPWEGFSFVTGVQSETSRQHGMGGADITFSNPFGPPFVAPVNLRSDLDKATTDENLELRYTKIPFTVLFGEARLQQEKVGHYEDQTGGGPREFLRDTDESSASRDLRFGFNTSPWQRVSFGAHYRNRIKETRYDHFRDEGFFGAANDGYSAFIRSRETYSDEAEARLVVRPSSWLKTTVSYRVVATDFKTMTDAVPGFFGPDTVSPGGWVFAGNYDANIYSFNAVITPFRRLYFSSTFTAQDSRTATRSNNSPYLIPYQGETYNVLSSAHFTLSEKTALQLSYSFSYADYGQIGQTAGLPLGLEYQRHGVQAAITRNIDKYFQVKLQYGWFYYDEPSSGNFNDYTAHLVFAALSVKWP